MSSSDDDRKVAIVMIKMRSGIGGEMDCWCKLQNTCSLKLQIELNRDRNVPHVCDASRIQEWRS